MSILRQVVQALKGLMLCLCWLAIVSVSGLFGLAVGYEFWSQYFWTIERPVGFLSPTGIILTLITGLGFALGGETASLVFWRRRLNSQL